MAQAAPIPGQGTWQATLQPRDLDHDGTTDAFYDTALNITWLREAGFHGAGGWQSANDWANNLNFGGYTDWRLPTMIDSGSLGCPDSDHGADCGYNVLTKVGDTVYSEMAYLFVVELGNPSGPPQPGVSSLTNTGDFINLPVISEGRPIYRYWTGVRWGNSAFDPEDWRYWSFNANGNLQGPSVNYAEIGTLVVRPGDVAVVPEPSGLALAAVGLLVLATGRPRRPG